MPATHPARSQFDHVPASKQLDTAGVSSQPVWRFTIQRLCKPQVGPQCYQTSLIFFFFFQTSLIYSTFQTQFALPLLLRRPILQFLPSLQTSNNSSLVIFSWLFFFFFAKKIETNQEVNCYDNPPQNFIEKTMRALDSERKVGTQVGKV